MQSDTRLEDQTYQKLRERLVDRTRRNRLLHFAHSTKGAMLRIVDEVPDSVLSKLQSETSFKFRALPDPETEPTEERTSDFKAALATARITDNTYRAAVAALDQDDASAEAKEQRLERELRDRVREKLGLEPRPQKRNIDLVAHAQKYGVNPSYDLPTVRSAVRAEDDTLQTLLFPEQLKARVAGLANKAREIERETGVATLYLAIGFLDWFESDASDIAFSSPLLLMPVTLERRRNRTGQEDYSLTARGEAPISNLSLELGLRDKHSLKLPVFNPEKDTVETYLQAVLDETATLKRRRIRRFMTLASFGFARIAMYHDLDPANWQSIPNGPPAHHLVRPLLRGIGDVSDQAINFSGEYEIDHPEVESLAPILITDADSSQHSATIDVMRGRSLVIEGPPGTGKSQTIANLIANILHAGKRVLFVSEKMAALEVVKSRLDKAGLGQFCLALHSAGASPGAVVAALQERAAATPPTLPSTASVIETQLDYARAELRAHLDVFHAQVGPLGESLHGYIGRLADLARLLPFLPALLRNHTGDIPRRLNEADIAKAKESLEILEARFRDLMGLGLDLTTYPFHVLERSDLLPHEQADLLVSIEAAKSSFQKLRSDGDLLRRWLGRPQATLSVAAVQKMGEEVAKVPDLAPGADSSILVLLTSKFNLEDGKRILQNHDALSAAAEALRKSGINDAAQFRGDIVQAIETFVAPLGIEQLTIAQVCSNAREAEGQAAAWSEWSRTVEALCRVLDLPANPELGAIRLACAASGLVAKADPVWLTYCRPGLEHHHAVLAVGAKRQQELESRISELALRFDIEGVSHVALRQAATALQNAGVLSVLRNDVREAKRLFTERWRGGPRPKTAQWSAELLSAADVLAERYAFSNDRDLCLALGEKIDPWQTPLHLLAAAAHWQTEVASTLSGLRPEVATLCNILVSRNVAQLTQLAALAGPAQALLNFLADGKYTGDITWSALRDGAVARGAALSQLAQALAAIALPDNVRISDLAPMRSAYEQWRAAGRSLSADPARELLAVVAPTTLKATVNFAQEIWKHYRELGIHFLADGWTQRVATLRHAAEQAQKTANTTILALDFLSRLGLASVAQAAMGQDIEAVLGQLDSLLAVQPTLSAYLDFVSARQRCRRDVLAAPVLNAFDKGSEPLHHLPEALDWLVAWSLIKSQSEANRERFSCSGDELSRHRYKFAEADRGRQTIDVKKVQRAVLSRPVPAGSSVGSRKEWTGNAVLLNEYTKQQRHIPVRDLLDRAGNAVLTLAPCLMMSPLTVAQYLKPGGIEFDVVIMDEASQIKPEDALGAMLRARQAVIVGDPKQLPPTNFFDRVDKDDGDEVEEDDVAAESVLKLASSAFQPSRRLRWHYRSQHESLIAFSNHKFYNDSLVIFPSSDAPSESLGVELVRVSGIWRERINVEEARAIAITASDAMRRHPNLSLGIVAMNQPQRDLIKAELEALVAADEALGRYFEDWNQRFEEPFVKNLENVQGDERDVIMISLGWGRTPEGTVHQRFYPVNRKADGDRRLNVLFTRAKRKVVLFSSLDAEDIAIDPEKTSPGVKILRDYLAYARDGQLNIARVDEREADSPFEESVANALRALGHDVVLQVGVAGYRIDIGVRHPLHQDKFVLGIECDGAAYHSAKSARDRDRLRQEALERLGWKLARVWSTDWFRDPATQAQKLSAEIKRAVQADTAARPAKPRLVESVIISGAAPSQVHAVAQIGEEEPCEASKPPESMDALPTPAARRPTSLRDALVLFRDGVIMTAFPGSEPGRCILRDEMIECIIKSRLDDPDDFHQKVPEYLRSRTDGRQATFLGKICDLIADFSVTS